MNIRYKEDPNAWCKSTLLTVLGLALLSSLLRWRHVLNTQTWIIALVLFVLAANLALVRPKWFRGYYRFSTWAGFWSSQAVARVFLAGMFFLIIVPAGFVMRALGKDPLRLHRSADATSYWTAAKSDSPLDRLF